MTVGFPDLAVQRFGSRSGRIQPVSWSPTDGDYALALGADDQGVKVEAKDGDYVEWQQTVDLTSLTLLTFSCFLRQSVGTSKARYTGRVVQYPTGFAGGETLDVTLDALGGDPLVANVVFQATDQDADAVVSRIQSYIPTTRGTVWHDQGSIRIESALSGYYSRVHVTGGTAVTALGMPVGFNIGARVSFKLSIMFGAATLFEAPVLEDGETIDRQTYTINVASVSGSDTLRIRLTADNGP